MSRGSLSFKEAAVVARPLWWVTTSVPFIVGALLAKPELNFALVIGALYFTLPYNLLMYGVNDIFDYESDIQNARKTGVAHGKVLSKLKHPALWRAIALVNIPYVLLLLIIGNAESNVFLFMMIYLACAYSIKGLRYKEMPFIDSLTSGFHYASPFIFGLFLFSSPDLWAPAFAGFYFWAVGNHAFGAIQDIQPDRKAGIKSIATYLGAAKTIIFCVTAYGLAILAPILGYGRYGLVAAVAIVPYLLTVLYTYKFRSNPNASQYKTVWRRFLIMHYIIGGIGSMFLIYLYNK